MRKKLIDSLKHIDGTDATISAYNSFDIIGDIAVTKLPDHSVVAAQAIAEAIKKRHKNIKTVLAQDSAVTGEYRLRKLTCIKGENKTSTIHKESGCLFSVDLAYCYFSPRLSGERLRVANLVQHNETVVNMFAGVGCFSIIIAKHVPSAKVYSIDINPNAFAFMKENIRLNRVFGQVVPMLGDAKNILESQLQGCADRVLMPLPEKALAYLPYALLALKPSGGWIHLHLFEHVSKDEDLTAKVKQKVKATMEGLGFSSEIFSVRIVRSTGPNWRQLVVDLYV